MKMVEKFESEDLIVKIEKKTVKKRWCAIGTFIILAIIAVAVGILIWLLTRSSSHPQMTANITTTVLPNKIDCHPDPLPRQSSCVKRGCIWTAQTIPQCYYPADFGYKMTSLNNSTSGGTISLVKISQFSSPFGSDIHNVTFTYHSWSCGASCAPNNNQHFHVLNFKIKDAKNKRYEVPVPMWPSGKPAAGLLSDNPLTIKPQISSAGTFSFSVTRKSTGTVLWDTSIGGFVYSNQYLQISTYLPTSNVFGLGENVHWTFKHDFSNYTTWPVFARDQFPDSEIKNNNNLYGVHPFYICIEPNGTAAHGVLLLNSNAQEFAMGPTHTITYRAIGGIFDFYIFPGPRPEDVIRQYHTMIGHPVMPAYWALGFQICRYGYHNLSEVAAVINRTAAAKIPYDVQYIDIDYMSHFRDFTVDNVNFKGLAQFVNQTQTQNHLRWIFITDAAVEATDASYLSFMRGQSKNVFIGWPNSNMAPPMNQNFSTTNGTNLMLGVVWPDSYSVFPDFFHPNTTGWWVNEFQHLYNITPWDGVWIDMNEPANFGTNFKKPWYYNDPVKPHIPALQCPSSQWETPPYMTQSVYQYQGFPQQLSIKTICMVASQGMGKYQHYDVHSLFGWGMMKATRTAVQKVTGKRSVVISRSTFPSSGQYGGHWLGDNKSTWAALRTSIIGMMEFDIFGIPYIGADICGFRGSTTEELCMRWMQLGAFYPFSRNHNAKGEIPQDPAVWPKVAEASRQALNFRYWFLPTLYTHMYHAYRDGAQVIRAMALVFPTDPVAMTVDQQFLWGDFILITPVLTQGVTNVSGYFPGDIWYTISPLNYATIVNGPVWMTLPAPQNHVSLIPVHIRAGHIAVRQAPALNTAFSRQNPFELLVAVRPSSNDAVGYFYWDDGESIQNSSFTDFYHMKFNFKRDVHRGINQLFMSHISPPSPNLTTPTLDILEFLGVLVPPNFNSLIFDGQQISVGPYTSFNASIQRIYIQATGMIKLNMVKTLPNYSLLQWNDATELNQRPNVVDCHPDTEKQPSQARCLQRNCTWAPHMIPNCYYPANWGYSMVAQDITGQVIQLQRNSSFSSPFSNDINSLNMSYEWLYYLGRRNEMQLEAFHFKFLDKNNPKRYAPPVPLWQQKGAPSRIGSNNVLNFVPLKVNGDALAFQIVRNSTGSKLWDTSIGGFVYSDKFLQISTILPSQNLYGFGETTHQSFRHDFSRYKIWPAFSRDNGPWSESEDFRNLYGVHAFYLCIEPDGNAHGVFLLNSNAQEFVIGPKSSLTYRSIGGILDFYVFPGPSPDDVVRQYHTMIGYPVMPAYWALGFQLCRWGYKNTADIKAAVQRTLSNGIPLDVQYADIDYMHRSMDFTLNETGFADLPAYVQQLKSQGMHWIFIVDPAISVESTSEFPYPTFTNGTSMNVYTKWPNVTSMLNNTNINNMYTTTNGSTWMLGVVWPDNHTAFPDFFLPNTTTWWIQQHQYFHDLVLPFDGIWIDMNEPANFETNKAIPYYPQGHPDIVPLHCPVNPLDDPPYKTHSWGPRLSEKTICMTGQHTDGTNIYNHYDVHSLYGWSEAVATRKAVQQVTGQRSAVISRSTFAGSGVYAGHWLGDNSALWSDLVTSIYGIMEFDMFGISYIGADICGFGRDTNEELCLRWQQLGAFYPFSRNHNAWFQKDQDPGMWPSVARATRQAMQFRYHYLPFLYTLLYQAYTGGDGVLRPLAFQFPNDPVALGIDKQFLWGHNLLITPVTQPGVSSVLGYFPARRWYTLAPKNVYGQVIAGPQWVSLAAANTTMIPIHVLEGSILPRQMYANNTVFSRRNPFEILIAISYNNQAMGQLFWDNGTNININGMNSYHIHFHYFRKVTTGFNKLLMASFTNTTSAQLVTPTLDIIEILGIPKMANLTTLTFDGTSVNTDHAQQNQTISANQIWLNIPGMIKLDEIKRFPDITGNHSMLTWFDQI